MSLLWTKYIGILSLLQLAITSKGQGCFLIFSVDNTLGFIPIQGKLTFA